MKKIYGIIAVFLLLCSCTSQGKKQTNSSNNQLAEVTVKYATGFSVRDSADIRLVDVGKKDHFALVRDAEDDDRENVFCLYSNVTGSLHICDVF